MSWDPEVEELRRREEEEELARRGDGGRRGGVQAVRCEVSATVNLRAVATVLLVFLGLADALAASPKPHSVLAQLPDTVTNTCPKQGYVCYPPTGEETVLPSPPRSPVPRPPPSTPPQVAPPEPPPVRPLPPRVTVKPDFPLLPWSETKAASGSETSQATPRDAGDKKPRDDKRPARKGIALPEDAPCRFERSDLDVTKVPPAALCTYTCEGVAESLIYELPYGYGKEDCPGWRDKKKLTSWGKINRYYRRYP